MKFGKKQMNLEEGLKREWIITNGMGGFASSTIIGCNTRKYHGLLIAPLTPPARRFLILSKKVFSVISFFPSDISSRKQSQMYSHDFCPNVQTIYLPGSLLPLIFLKNLLYEAPLE